MLKAMVAYGDSHYKDKTVVRLFVRQIMKIALNTRKTIHLINVE